MTERTYGNKYDSKLSTKDIAKRVRDEIKALKKAGTLPAGLVTSVRYRSFAGGTSIDVRVTAVPFNVFNPEWIAHEIEHPHDYYTPHIHRFSDEARRLKATLESLLSAYNHDGSNSMVDHFDVNFYGHVDFDWKMEEEHKAALTVPYLLKKVA